MVTEEVGGTPGVVGGTPGVVLLPKLLGPAADVVRDEVGGAPGVVVGVVVPAGGAGGEEVVPAADGLVVLLEALQVAHGAELLEVGTAGVVVPLVVVGAGLVVVVVAAGGVVGLPGVVEGRSVTQEKWILEMVTLHCGFSGLGG